MSMKPLSHRYLIESFENKVEIIIPSRKNVLYFVWFAIWMFMWGYATSRLFLLWELMIKGAFETHDNGVLMMLIVCLAPFLIALLGMGAFAIHTVLWHIAGSEIIEATSQALTVTKQVFRWKWSKVYSSKKILDLRTNPQKLSMFFPRKRSRRYLGGPGMIAFDYGGRTPSFGYDISDKEAEHIILALKEGLPQQNAG
jgi:hypothetical protein